MGALLAVFLSFFIVGLGQFYNGQALKGILLLFLALILAIFSFGVLAIPIWIYGLMDAYSVANKKAS